MTDKIHMIQTASGDSYKKMLFEGRKINRLYCEKFGITYQDYIGIKRGYYDWHACFNRIVMLDELIRGGYRGWIFYLDADAYIYDPKFDVRDIMLKDEHALLASPGGFKGQWDINDGVFLLNLGAEKGRKIANLWFQHFMSTTDEQLKGARNWQDVPSDQPRLHSILQKNPDLENSVLHLSHKIFNHVDASFVRQVLRSNAKNVDDRLSRIVADVAESLKRI
jgi:hypothetical protein